MHQGSEIGFEHLDAVKWRNKGSPSNGVTSLKALRSITRKDRARFGFESISWGRGRWST